MIALIAATAWALDPVEDAAWDAWDDLPTPIVGGEPAEEGDWPDAVAVYGASNYACSAVLIAPDLVLTAAHCNFGLASAVIDTVDHRNTGETIEIAESWTYADSWTTYDIALLRLATPTTTEPRTLVQDCLVDLLNDEADVMLVGFGAVDSDASKFPGTLHAVQAPVVESDCANTSTGCNDAIMPGGEFIAGGDGIDSCNGDSGGPAYLLTPHGAFLAGITSRQALPADVNCGDGGIYVRVDAVIDWIEEQSGQGLQRPDCDGINRAPRPLYDDIVLPLGAARSTTSIAPNDPDDDGHGFVIVEEPAHGTASVDADGLVSYVPASVLAGAADSLRVEVRDDGDPSLATIVTVAITPTASEGEEPGGCGCTSGRPSWSLSSLFSRR